MPKSVPYAKTAARAHLLRIEAALTDLPPCVRGFIRYLDDTTTPLTRLAYVYDLRVFFEYLMKETLAFSDFASMNEITAESMRRVTLADLQGYPGYLTLYFADEANEKSPVENAEAGKMRKLCSLRSFYNYLFENKYIDGNLASLVPLPKRREHAIIRLEPNEVARLLDVAESGDALPERTRNYCRNTRARDVALLTLLLGTGIRVSECIGINLDDLNFEENAMLVTRKGAKEMILYFSAEVARALKAYIAERNEIIPLEGHEDALFLSLQKRRITQRAVENLVKKYAAVAAPLKRKISPHKLRSTYGTALYQETGDIYLVADVLGHTDVNTTRKHYAAMSDERRRMAANKVKLRED